MQLFLYWILVPALFGLTFAGLGLLVRAASRDLAAELVFPAGIAASVVLSALLTYFSWTAALAAPALLLGAAAGWGLMLRSDRSAFTAALRTHWTWIAAGVAGFLAFGASVILSGKPSFTGYTQIVDIAHQFDIAAWVAQHGRDLPADAISSSEGVINKTLGGGYPTGSQSGLGAYARFFGFEMAWAYQPFLSLIAAALVPALALLLKPVVASARFRAVGAFTAAQASILVGYAQIGGIKELCTILLLAFAAGAATRLRDEADRPAFATVLPVALAAAATFSVLSLTTLPWLGLVAIGALVYAARSVPPRVLAVRGAVAVALFAVLALPTLQSATKTGGAVSVVQNDADIGNLAAPVGHLAASGIWFTADHRYPITEGSTAQKATTVVGGLTVVLAILGLGLAWRRKARGLVILAAAGVVGLGVIVYVMSPWIELKAMAVMAPISLLLAVVALSAPLASRRLAPLAWLGLAALLAAVTVADLQRYRGAVLAPHDRLQELADLGSEFAGQGPALLPDFEEQGEYLMREAQSVSPVNASPKSGFPIRPEVAKVRPGVQLQWDLDEIEPDFVQSFPVLVTRHAAEASRAPGNYDLVRSTRYYNVWKRSDRPMPTEHVPLSSTGVPADRKVCRTFLGRNGQVPVTVSTASVASPVVFEQKNVSLNLPVMNPQQLAVAGPGFARGTVSLPRAGRYELFFATNAYRETTLKVDGRTIAKYSDNSYALRPDRIATLQLSAGLHRIELVRGGGSLSPGTIDPGGHVLGPVYFVPEGRSIPAITTADGAATRCPERIDWLEARR